MQHDVPESAIPQKDAVTTPSTFSISSVDIPRSVFHSYPETHQAAGSPGGTTKLRRPLSASCAAIACGTVLRRGLNNLGVVLAQPVDHQCDFFLGVQPSRPDICARQSQSSASRRRDPDRSIARPTFARIASRELIAALPFPDPPTTHGRSGRGSPRRSRVIVHRPPIPGRPWIQPSLRVKSRSPIRPRRCARRNRHARPKMKLAIHIPMYMGSKKRHSFIAFLVGNTGPQVYQNFRDVDFYRANVVTRPAQ